MNPMQSQTAKPAKSHFILRAFLIFLTVVFTALGFWQVQRLFWKLDLIERVDARVHAPAVPPPARPQWPELDPAEAEYRHVIVTGVFDHGRETLVQAVTERGAGFWVMTPLRQTDGTTVLVNRGFVPPDRKDPAFRAEGQVVGDVTVEGLLRITEPGGGFLRKNDPAGGNWYSRDVGAIGASKGIGDLAPFFIDADSAPNPGRYPIGGLTVIQFHNSHLVYLLTWFSLALMAAAAAVFLPRLLRQDD